MTESHQILNSLSEEERALFHAEYNRSRKDPTHGLLFALVIGTLGGHRFYLAQPGLGLLYILFCWTLVPTIVSIVECYYIVDRVHRYNDTVANDIVARMRTIRPPS